MSSLDRIVGSRSIRPSPRRVGRPPIFDEISLRNTGARTRAPVLPATRAASEAPAAGLTSTTASRAARSNPRRLRAPGVPIQEPTAPGANRGAANRAGPRRYSLNTRLPSASAWFITSCACDRRSVRVRECTRIPDGRNYLELRRSSPAMAGLLSDGGPGYEPHAPRMVGWALARRLAGRNHSEHRHPLGVCARTAETHARGKGYPLRRRRRARPVR
jgi:hypothetical protein